MRLDLYVRTDTKTNFIMFGEGIGTASINMIGNLLGAGFQNYFNGRQAEKQNEFNLEMWNLQNAYNSPQAQMQRFEQAGLNPNLMYSQGTPGNSTQAPQKIAAQPADWQRALSNVAGGLGEAFNLIGLKSALLQLDITNQHLKQEQLKTADMRDEYLSWYDMGKAEWDSPAQAWVFNPTYYKAEDGRMYWINSGAERVYNEGKNGGVTVTRRAPNTSYFRALARGGSYFGRNALIPERAYNLSTSSSRNRAWTNQIVPSTINRNNAYINFLAPQTRRLLFETTPWRMETDWWNRQINTAAGSIGKALDAASYFTPMKGAKFLKARRVFYDPNSGRAYNY